MTWICLTDRTEENGCKPLNRGNISPGPKRLVHWNAWLPDGEFVRMETLKTVAFSILACLGVVAFFRLWTKWAEWIGYGKGFPRPTKIQTLLGDQTKNDSH
jgi:hypothetical protein